MIYGITGHTSGIGYHLSNSVDRYIGFSRSNGYDIENASDRKKIIEELAGCDIFINNACSGFHQSQLLLDYWHAYKHTDKVVINVGSVIADLWVDYDKHELLGYQMHKKTLKTLVDDLNTYSYPLHIEYVSFGYVGTEKILQKYPGIENYISLDEAVKRILKCNILQE